MATKHEMAHPAAAALPRRLPPHAVAKPWGRHVLGPWGLGHDRAGAAEPIGEIHHLGPSDDAELLFKTLFTSERLSIQVHPDDVAAHAAGLARGKDEAWVVLAAEPGATIGLGLEAPCDSDTLRAAALDGSIVDRLTWHTCAAGDVFFTPAGSIHAIGAGLTVFEIQQNCDVTYRLYDYGRGRELHLDDGLAVSTLAPWQRPPALPAPGPGRDWLVAAPRFVMEKVVSAGSGKLRPPAAGCWVAVITGAGQFAGLDFAAGEVWWMTGPATVRGAADLLVAYALPAPAAGLWEGE